MPTKVVQFSRRAHYLHLDAIRGLAALVVFLNYASCFLLHKSAPALAVPRPIESQAIVVFLVLSGFLVGGGVLHDKRKNRWSWSRYLWQRLTRLSVVMVPALVLSWAINQFGIPHLTEHTLYDASKVVLWNLAPVCWCYLAFPLLVSALLEKQLSIRLANTMLLGAMVFFVSPEISVYFLVWLTGVLASCTPARIPKQLHKATCLLSLLLFLGVELFLERVPLPLIAVNAIATVLFSLVLYCSTHQQPFKRLSFYRRTCGFLARISFTLYAVQIPALIVAFSIASPLLQDRPTAFLHLAYSAVVLCCAFLCACTTYFCFEAHTEKIRDWGEKLVSKPIVSVQSKATVLEFRRPPVRWMAGGNTSSENVKLTSGE